VTGPALSASSFDSDPVAAAAACALDDARTTTGVPRTALFWLDDASSRLICVATSGAGASDRWIGQTLAAGLGMAGRAVREDRPVWSPDLLADPRVPIAPWLRERLEAEGLRVVAAAPVRIHGTTRGALGFLAGPGRQYDGEGLQRIGDLADRVAAALARAAGPSS
jgi:GAF domain-containing protein